jgi:hypothetical protein
MRRENAEERLEYINTYSNYKIINLLPAQLLSDGDLDRVRLQVTSAMIERAELKALLKFKKSDFNAVVCLAEARKTADMVGSTALNLAKSMMALRRGRFADARAHLGLRRNDQPANWLQLQYGWKPMLSDVFNATESVKKAAGFGNTVVTVKASVREESTFSSYIDENHPLSRIKLEGKAEAGVFVRLDAEPDVDLLIWANSLGLTNPLLVGWELLPFSFVLDWMVPVGDWLSALDATLGWKFKSGSRTRRTAVVANAKRAPFHDPWYVYQHPVSYGGGSTASEKRVDREVYTSFPTPYFPRIKNPLSLGHMANGLSLLAQVFSGRR